MTFAAQGEVTVEPHDPTDGVKIVRETPELDYQQEQMVVLPSKDAQRVVEEISNIIGADAK